MVVGIVVALFAGIAALAWYFRPEARAERTLRRLESRYFSRVQIPQPLARESLHRHVARLSERHPGRGPVWYVAQVLLELDRDRR